MAPFRAETKGDLGKPAILFEDLVSKKQKTHLKRRKQAFSQTGYAIIGQKGRDFQGAQKALGPNLLQQEVRK